MMMVQAAIERDRLKKETDLQKNRSLEALQSRIGPKNSIDATSITDMWFPAVSADVFISHSHADETLAVDFACWLKHNLGLTAFIDSTVWGNANELLKEIDNHYCKNTADGTYIYEKRNGTTSHVHILLATALASMIDKTECLIFLNTPTSLSASQAAQEAATYSPWIYLELSVASTIRERDPHEHRQSTKTAAGYGNVIIEARSFSPVYRLGDRLMPAMRLDASKLNTWVEHFNQAGGHALDALYGLFLSPTPPKRR